MTSTRYEKHCEPSATSNAIAASVQGRSKPKLRSSCQACSISKLKCPQEKPTCSRCAKRSLKCEYFAAKPGGRKPGRSLAASQARSRMVDGAAETNQSNEIDLFAKNTGAAPAYLPLQHDVWFHLPSCVDPQGGDNGDTMQSPDAMLHHQSLSPQSTSMAMDFGPPLGAPHHGSSCSVSSTGTGQMTLGDCFSPPMSFTTDRTDFDLLGATTNLFSTDDGVDAANESNNGKDCGNNGGSHKDIGSLLFNTEFTPFLDGELSSEAFADFTSVHGHRVSLSVPSLDLPHDHESHNPPRHSCFARALRSLDKMSSDSYTRYYGSAPAVADIIADNEAVMEDLGSMLECSCSEDGYMLYIAALIMSKALDSYSQVAHLSLCSPQLDGASSAHSESKDCGSSNSSSNTKSAKGPEEKFSGRRDSAGQNDRESARITAQLVLSKLYLARRLIAKLSGKLKRLLAVNGKDQGTESLVLQNSRTVDRTACLFTVGNHFAEALARRLKALSLDISHHLRAA